MTPQELFARWAAWNEHNVLSRAVRRADERGDAEGAATLRAWMAAEPVPVSATEALAAQSELASLLSGWRWHTVTAAREQGATWADIAAATGAAPDTARGEYRAALEQAEDTAAEFGLSFPDADRYRAAARPDIAQELTEDETMTDSDDRDPGEPPWVDRLEQNFPPDVAHSTPIPVDDHGTVEGVIELPGGLPPDEDDDEDDTRRAAARDRAALDTGARPAPQRGQALAEPVDDTTAWGDRPSSPAAAPDVDQVPWFETAEGQAHIGRWAVDIADPANAAADGPIDDPDELQRQLDAIRTRLTGYTWREGVDRDEAITDRREQLGRWYADDNVDHDIFPAATTHASDAADDDGGWSDTEGGSGWGR